MDSLKEYILKQVSTNALEPDRAMMYLSELGSKNDTSDNKIAVIGMACDLSEAQNYHEFWGNILNERDALGYMPREFEEYYRLVENPHFSEVMGTKPFDIAENHFSSRSSYIKDSNRFDAAFFGIPPREARCMEPGQRVFLETACSAIEDAGYSLDTVRGANIGVFVGKDHNNAEFYKTVTKPDTLSTTGSWHGILASRISYIFNFKGPALVIDTACSSGLVSIHEACRALQTGDCDMAIAGGVSIGGSPADGSKDPDEAEDALDAVAASDSIVRPFDKKSTGTVFGEGCAAFLLKPLNKAIEDGDNIHSVILASAANNDGASNGITAPNPAAQTDVISKAWNDAGIDPRSISYIETHGTGTLLGDPIEFKALNNAFRQYTDDIQFCGIGSVKSNMGHLVAASGCVGMMKVILAMKNKTLPASINFEEPNPHISFIDSALHMVDRAIPWEGKVLHAGISSFGFSGTNVHVVLESAEHYVVSSDNNEKHTHILTMSAKTEWSLEKLIARYSSYLAGVPDINMDSLCYTACIGRGHYNYRAAIIFSDCDELQRKLERLEYCGIDNVEDGVCYGYYKVVSNKRMERARGEYTESEIKRTNERAETIINSIRENGLNAQNARKLCECYVSGADIAFEVLYEDRDIQRIHLPTYAFERTVYWAQSKELTAKDINDFGEANDHPLVERCLLRTIDQDIYVTRFSVKKHWILHDHVIMGKNIIPGTAYVELAREVCSKYIDGDIELRDLIFMTPLGVDRDEEVEAQIIVKKLKDHVEFTVATKKDDIDAEGTEWLKHVEGRAYALKADMYPGAFDLSVLDSDTSLVSSPVNLAGLDNRDAVMCFGARWQNIERVYVSSGAKYVHAKLADEFADDLNTFRYHTSILDASVNAGIQASMEGVYLPFVFKSMKLYRPLPQEIFSRAICKNPNASSDETYTYDVRLMDSEGNTLVDITDYTIKKVHKFNNYEDKNYYCINWIPKERAADAVPELGNVLLINSEALGTELLEKIKKVAKKLTYVKMGKVFAKLGPGSYKVDCSIDGYRKLFGDDKNREINTVIFAGAYGGQSDGFAPEGLYTLFFLTKALILEKIRGNIDVVILTDYASYVTGNEKCIKPENAAVIGLGRCVVQEYANIKTRSIDVDCDTASDELMRELLCQEHTECVALRGKQRYVECLTKFECNAQIDEVPLSISEGCVLITGGTGGLGIEAAKYMAEKGASNICLIGRRSFPKKNEWKTILETGSDQKLCSRIEVLSEIEKKGINVFTRSADVVDEVSMRELVESLEKDFGKINTVIHCAGIAGDGFIVNKSIETFKGVISPKIIGTKVLDKVLDWNNVELFIVYSSMTSLFGGSGQGDYTAANAYLDAYAQQGSLMHKPIVSINWPAWSETGMAADYNVSDAIMLFSSVDNKTAIAYLDDVITYRLSNIVPGKLNYAVLAEIADERSVVMAPNIRKAVELQKRRSNNTSAGNASKNSVQDVLLLGKATDEFTDTEKKVACIYAGVLDIEEIDIYENFNSLGGNSMTSTEMLKILNQYFDDILEVSDVFSYPNVYEMAEYIDSKLGGVETEKAAEVTENVNELLVKLESDEIEVDQMLEFFSE